jgi:hypothetical protein
VSGRGKSNDIRAEGDTNEVPSTRMAAALPLIPIRLFAFSRRASGFYIACASSACAGKSELGLKLAAPECTMVGSASWYVHCRLCAASRSACQRLRSAHVASGPRQELLRQIAVPMEGVDFAS